MLCEHDFNLDGLLDAREQLFAEALEAYRARERCYPSQDEQAQLFTPEQTKRGMPEPFEDILMPGSKTGGAVLDGRCGMRWAEPDTGQAHTGRGDAARHCAQSASDACASRTATRPTGATKAVSVAKAGREAGWGGQACAAIRRDAHDEGATMIGNRPAFTAAKSLIQNAVSAQQQYACQARKLPNLPNLCIEVGKAKVLIRMVVFDSSQPSQPLPACACGRMQHRACIRVHAGRKRLGRFGKQVCFQ